MQIHLRLLTPLLLFFVASLISMTSPAAQPRAPTDSVVSISGEDVDVGIASPLSTHKVSTRIRNVSDKRVTIDRIEPRWSGAGTNPVIRYENAVLEPNESTDVHVEFKLTDRVGRFSVVFLILSKTQREPIGKLVVRGFADWIVDPSSTVADVGIRKVDEPISVVLAPQSRPGVPVKLTKLASESRLFRATVVDDGAVLRVEGRPNPPWGPFDELIEVHTDSTFQPTVGFRLKGQIRGAVVPSTSSIEFGLVRVGEAPEQIVRVSDETGKALKLGKISIDGASAEAVTTDCIPSSASCKLIKLQLGERQEGSALQGLMTVQVPDYNERLVIPFGGASIGKDTVVRNIEDVAKAAQSSPQSLSSALQGATRPRRDLEMPKPSGTGPLLTWQVEHESQIYGYEIYRSNSADGTYQRLNKNILLKMGDETSSSSLYRWRDSSAEPGKKYWYYVGIVQNDGRKKPLNAAREVVAK